MNLNGPIAAITVEHWDDGPGGKSDFLKTQLKLSSHTFKH